MPATCWLIGGCFCSTTPHGQNSLPSWIGRWRLSRGWRSRLGSHLLRDAIARSVAAAEIVGIRALLVHVLHEPAREFYLHHDFDHSPTDPLHLMSLMKDARKIVGGRR
jgi:hypothetical protein